MTHDPRTCENSKPCYDCEHPCPHEDDVHYIDLLQVDGEPLYTVKCETCGEYGTIALVEDENTFGLTLNDIEEITRDGV